ncbi:MAG: PAS domain-containing protein, partial [Gemmatimonadaceae bacterium]
MPQVALLPGVGSFADTATSLEELLEALPEPLVVLDAEWRLTRVNRAAERLVKLP